MANNQHHVRPPQSPAMIEVVADNENTSVCYDDQQRKRAENIRPHRRQQNTAHFTKH